jgi:4-coumarate--CoA ligase
LPTAHSAAQAAGIPTDHIVLFNTNSKPVSVAPHNNLDGLIITGQSQKPNFIEKRLTTGEAKKKLAFLSFSSGTTGKPKVKFAWSNHISCL